ncbi:MAG: DMT family transporter [Candidatus Ornithomonoglobus sp.]
MIKSDKAKGALCIIASAFCFALMNMFVRLAGDLPSIEKSFFRNIVAAVIAAVTLIKSRESFMWQKGSLPGLIARSAFGTMGILCNFYAIDHLVLADASMLNKLSPFFAVIFSFLILKERVTLFQGAMVITAFIGSLFIIKPTPGLLNPASLVGLCGGLGAGIAYTMVRKLTEKGERKTYIVFFFSAFSCILTLPYLIFDFHPMTWQQLLILICAGISAAGGQFTITAAYSYAPAREISVFDYTQIIFAAALGFFVFGQIPDLLSVIGYVIICGVSLTMFLRNKKQAA